MADVDRELRHLEHLLDLLDAAESWEEVSIVSRSARLLIGTLGRSGASHDRESRVVALRPLDPRVIPERLDWSEVRRENGGIPLWLGKL